MHGPLNAKLNVITDYYWVTGGIRKLGTQTGVRF